MDLHDFRLSIVMPAYNEERTIEHALEELLARAVDEEVIPLTAAVQSHWDLCLQCRACEAVCPSGVAYGRIISPGVASGVTPNCTVSHYTNADGNTIYRLTLTDVTSNPQTVTVVANVLYSDPAHRDHEYAVWVGIPFLSGGNVKCDIFMECVNGCGSFTAQDYQVAFQVFRP